MTAAPPTMTVEPGRAHLIRSAATSGGIRLRPAPPLEPPFDDEVDRFGLPGGSVTDGQLALDLGHHHPPGPDSAGDARGDATEGPVGPGPWGTRAPQRESGASVVAALPEHRVAAKRFLGICLEVLNGYRAPGQLRSFCVPAEAGGVIERIAARAALVACGATTAAQRPGGAPRAGAMSGLDAASRTVSGRRPTSSPHRVRLRRLRVCRPLPGIAEAAVVLETGARCWAMAFRLERRRGNWLCTAVTLP